MESILKRNNVQIIGKGDQVILFAHGFGCDQQSWKYIVDSFTDDYQVVLFDYVGSGKSDLSQYDSFKYGNLNGYAQDVLDICEALQLKDSIFVGHSVSSMIGILAAIKQPAYFQKLVFIGPSPRYLNDEDYTGGFERADLENLFEFMDSNYLGWSSALAPAIMGNPDRPELGEFLTDSFCSNDPVIAREFARVTFFSDNRADLDKLRIKSLTLQCSEDIIAPLEVGNYVNKHTADNSLFIMRATGHCPHISEPEETIRAIKAFI
ncbi:sigma-B regulation protein RsbQ [Mucilaginibacter lappiensis]|uniref:Sigma-B regulation protein RsbQ n=1 Tax=Mucilaginibacter lappiensis TaxID=354630 RepID=A0ABR6PD86_9SPHI|nr:alpha/beta hydrolase [Mucilaginibacter lappiensis]MBB6107732.1 sigma-B regulation protein RsbQ [Mucilaginibacter lappiensis]